MKGYSLSAANRENTAGLKEREMESDHLSVRVCAGVRAESEVALMNESETKRGNAHRFSPFLSGSLITVRVSECFHRGGRPRGAEPMNWKTPFSERAQVTAETFVPRMTHAPHRSV